MGLWTLTMKYLAKIWQRSPRPLAKYQNNKTGACHKEQRYAFKQGTSKDSMSLT